MVNVSRTEPVNAAAIGRPRAEGEEALVRRAQAGDAAAYEELVRTHQRRMFAIVGRIARRSEDVEDVVQEVFVKAYFSLGRFDLRSSFSTWLYKIAVNESLDYLRKKRVRPLVYEADLGEDREGHARTLEGIAGWSAPAEQSAESHDFVDQLLGKLPEKERVLMLLKEVEGFSVDEISQMLDMNPNTIKVRLFRARGRLARFSRQRFARSSKPKGGR